MNQPSDDHALRELFQRLKARDRPEIPTLEAIVRRPPRERGPRVLRRWAVAGCSMAAILLLGLALALVDWHDRDRDPGRRRSAGSGAGKPPAEADMAKGRPQALDFGELQSAIDRYLEPYLALDYPVRANTTPSRATSWVAPTDSLLAMNLDVSFSQE